LTGAFDLGVTGRPLLSLKGWNKIAQGSALGTVADKGTKPCKGGTLFRPYRANTHTPYVPSQGVALGWHVGPLRGIGAGRRLRQPRAFNILQR